MTINRPGTSRTTQEMAVLSDEDKRRIEAEEQYRADVRARTSGDVQKTDFGEYARKARKRFVIGVYVIGGVVLLAILLGQLVPQ